MRPILMLSLLVLLTSSQYALADEVPLNEDAIERGKAIVFARSRGNCLACHAIKGGDLAGNYGPPLLLMKARYPKRADLRSKIWDASVREPTTRMPPYGRHRILTEDEIDLVVDFIHTL
ncbi:MAG: sulfur oxidation c-type cytochrome SoxX [Gammaproteobacteria bacterium]|nr:sulfur oxidation c-type cytochrome SoxX [Gammaproteobacteria bacterium]